MPRLKNKRHELYCYARVYRKAHKTDALKFAGLVPRGLNFRVEGRDDIQKRMEEMREIGHEAIYRDEFKETVDAKIRELTVLKGHNISREWFLEELYKNVELARASNKIKEATEALKAMAQVFKVLAEADGGEDQLEMRVTKLIGSNPNSAHAAEVSEEPEGSDGLGEDAGDASETGPTIEIFGPGSS